MRKIFLIAALLVASFATFAQTTTETFTFNSETRPYIMHIPEGLPAGAPLVMVLHPYKGSAEKASVKGFTECADRHGFAVCYPQGSIDTRGKSGWNVGYPSQEPCDVDDVAYICALTEHVCKKFGLSEVNRFCTGMSNGGDVCYTIALERADAFVAYAPIAGLTMEKAYKNGKPSRYTPFFEIHGTADHTSEWGGDPENKGGWGKYISVPLALQLWATYARCTHEVTETLPQMEDGFPVVAHRYVGGEPVWENGPETEVWLYEVQGAGHSWHQNSLDVCEEIWRFFSKWVR